MSLGCKNVVNRLSVPIHQVKTAKAGESGAQHCSHKQAGGRRMVSVIASSRQLSVKNLRLAVSRPRGVLGISSILNTPARAG
jgi:hypothetical protein